MNFGCAAVFLIILLAGTLAFPKVAAPPGDQPFIVCHTDEAVAETDQRVILTVESETMQYDNSTGNFSLLPSWSTVNVTIYDTKHDVVIDDPVLMMFNGSADYVFFVGGLWTSTVVSITVRDPQYNLTGHCGFRTEPSMDFVFWTFENKWTKSFQGYRESTDAKMQAELDTRTYLMLATFFSLSIALALAFLKYDHKRMRSFALPSLWDRFTYRVWHFSFLHDTEYIRHGEDQLESWDTASVERQREIKRDRAVRSLERQKARVQADIERVKAGGAV